MKDWMRNHMSLVWIICAILSAIMAASSISRAINVGVENALEALMIYVYIFAFIVFIILAIRAVIKSNAQKQEAERVNLYNTMKKLSHGKLEINGSMVGGIIAIIIGVVLFVAGCVFAFEERIILALFALGLGIIITIVSYICFVKSSTELHNKSVKGKVKNKKSILAVRTILMRANNNIGSILNDVTFYETGLKMMVLDSDGPCLVMLKDFAYDGLLGGFYDCLGKDYKKFKFKKGSETTTTQRYQVDVRKSANMGLFAGGLGVAALNAADAIEANANGGRKVTVGTGRYPIYFDVSKASLTVVDCVLVSKDVAERLGPLSEDVTVEKGEYFYKYQINTYIEVKADEIAQRLNRVVESIAIRG